jgi:uncharacterized protein
VLAGQPSGHRRTRAVGQHHADNLFNSPDGLAFDSFGRLWIQTDGSYSQHRRLRRHGQQPDAGGRPATKEIRRFLVGPRAASHRHHLDAGPPTMFVNIQHPGETRQPPERAQPAHRAEPGWHGLVREPDRARPDALLALPGGRGSGRPRSCTVVIRKNDGGVIGS